jgi:hypothetical protein
MELAVDSLVLWLRSKFRQSGDIDSGLEQTRGFFDCVLGLKTGSKQTGWSYMI